MNEIALLIYFDNKCINIFFNKNKYNVELALIIL